MQGARTQQELKEWRLAPKITLATGWEVSKGTKEGRETWSEMLSPGYIIVLKVVISLIA